MVKLVVPGFKGVAGERISENRRSKANDLSILAEFEDQPIAPKYPVHRFTKPGSPGIDIEAEMMMTEVRMV